MFRVDPQTHMDLDSFVEFSELDLLKKRNRLSEGVITRFDLLERSLVFFSGFPGHISSLVRSAARYSKRARLPLSLVGVPREITTLTASTATPLLASCQMSLPQPRRLNPVI